MEKLNSFEELIRSKINDAVKEAQPKDIVYFLIKNGFIDSRQIERFAILKDVTELVKNGMPVNKAMYEVAFKYFCSYEKVRGIYYQIKKRC